MTISNFFGLAAGMAALVTYGLYLKQTLKGESTPNPSTWAIWLLIGIINTATYFTVTQGSLWQSFIVAAVTFSVSVVFIYSLFRGKFSAISKIEIAMFVLAIIIGIFWRVTANDRAANLLLQAIYVISYLPTFAGIIKLTAKEHYTAWVVAFIAYVFSVISVATGRQADWVAYVHPIVNGLIGNGLVVVFIFYTKRRSLI